MRELPYSLEGKEIIVQRYLSKPLLLDGIKFDLRVYVVVTGFNPVQAYICDEGLARFCTVSEPKNELHIHYVRLRLTCTSFHFRIGSLRSSNKGKLQEGLHAPDKLFHQQD